jgi:hypothetical protein
MKDKNIDDQNALEKQNANFFDERKKRADMDAVLDIMNRIRGEVPRKGDELGCRHIWRMISNTVGVKNGSSIFR